MDALSFSLVWKLTHLDESNVAQGSCFPGVFFLTKTSDFILQLFLKKKKKVNLYDPIPFRLFTKFQFMLYYPQILSEIILMHFWWNLLGTFVSNLLCLAPIIHDRYGSIAVVNISFQVFKHFQGFKVSVLCASRHIVSFYSTIKNPLPSFVIKMLHISQMWLKRNFDFLNERI